MKFLDSRSVIQILGKWLKLIRRLMVWTFVLLALLGGLIFLLKPDLPDGDALPLVPGRLSFTWLDGTRESVIESEGFSRWIPLERIPLGLIQGVIAIEDFRYFRHPGIDINQIYYALIENIRNLGFDYGASTITQQVIKNVWLTKARSPIRKAFEAILALELETILDKEAILEWYLNLIEMAPGIFGIDAGSLYYFGREPSELLFGQQIALAAMIHSPNTYGKNGSLVVPRVKSLLSNLIEQGLIDQTQARAFETLEFDFSYQRPKANFAGLRKVFLTLWPQAERKGYDIELKTALDHTSQTYLEALAHALRADGEYLFAVLGENPVTAVTMVSEQGGLRLRTHLPAVSLVATNLSEKLKIRLSSIASSNRISFSTNKILNQRQDFSLLPEKN